MSILLTIVFVIFGLLALTWLLCFMVYGVALINSKLKNKNKNKRLEEIDVEPRPPLVSNIDGSELKQTTKIEPKNVADIDSHKKAIKNLLQKFVEDGNNVAMLTFGSMIGLDAPDIIGENADIAAKFEEYCNSILDRDNFIDITNARINLGEYIESVTEGVDIYYNLFVDDYYDKFIFFMANFKGYYDLVESKMGVIASKKRELVKENEFGDFDGSAWIDYLQRFAVRMNLTNPYHIISSDCEAVREYFKILKLDNFQGRLLGYLFSIHEFYQKREDPFANVITGVDFELLLKSMMESALPEAYVETTPATGDHGADLIARYKGITVAIQAKYYSGSVGNGAVQEIHSGMGFYDADFGMVVTQSSYTEHAKSLANKLGIYLESVDTFIDRVKVLAR